MTYNENMKCLEYCASENCDCSKCKLYVADDDDCNCSRQLKLKAVEIYKNQTNALQDLNKQLTEALKEAAVNKTKVIDCEKELNRLQAEVKKANRTVAGLMYENDELKRLVRPMESEKRSIAEFSFKKGKAEAYKECIATIKEEINKALKSNYKAKQERFKRKLGTICDFEHYCNGKIDCLRGLDDFCDNLLKELVGDNDG